MTRDERTAPGRGPHEGRTPLDPVAADLISVAAGGRPLSEVGAAAARLAAAEDFRDLLPVTDPAETMTWHERARGRPSVDLLVCRPATTRAELVILHLHGGGWVLGDPWWLEPVVRQIAVSAGAIVVSVDYRLAPEDPYPAALDDATTALRWVCRTYAHLPVAVMGESAGGNLAASLALLARGNDDLPIAAQCLLVPALDPKMSSRSWTSYGSGYGLDAPDMRWFWDCYAPPDGPARADPGCSPLLSRDLGGLPPAIVVTCGHDPLQDDGIAYAGALRAAAVPVLHLHRPELPHGFVWLGGAVPAAHAALDDAVDNLRRVTLDDSTNVGQNVQRER